MGWTTALRDMWAMLAALGTLAAVCVAIVGVRRESAARVRAEKRADAAEQAREADRIRTEGERATRETAAALERHRAQAVQVIAWVDQREGSSWTGIGGNRVVDGIPVLRLINDSGSPIFDVKLSLFDQRMHTDTPLVEFALIPAHGERTLDLRGAASEFSGVVRFRDLQGTWWCRYQNGHLVEHDELGQVVHRVLS